MTGLTVRDIIDLVASEVPDPEARLEKIFEWAHTRNLELAKWFLALAAGLLAAVAVGVLKVDPTARISAAVLRLTLFAAAMFAGGGLLIIARGKRIYRAHLAAQALLGEITKIRSFIELYRELT